MKHKLELPGYLQNIQQAFEEYISDIPQKFIQEAKEYSLKPKTKEFDDFLLRECLKASIQELREEIPSTIYPELLALTKNQNSFSIPNPVYEVLLWGAEDADRLLNHLFSLLYGCEFLSIVKPNNMDTEDFEEDLPESINWKLLNDPELDYAMGFSFKPYEHLDKKDLQFRISQMNRVFGRYPKGLIEEENGEDHYSLDIILNTDNDNEWYILFYSDDSTY